MLCFSIFLNGRIGGPSQRNGPFLYTCSSFNNPLGTFHLHLIICLPFHFFSNNFMFFTIIMAGELLNKQVMQTSNESMLYMGDPSMA